MAFTVTWVGGRQEFWKMEIDNSSCTKPIGSRLPEGSPHEEVNIPKKRRPLAAFQMIGLGLESDARFHNRTSEISSFVGRAYPAISSVILVDVLGFHDHVIGEEPARADVQAIHVGVSGCA
jgi:hypothetical protein